MSPSLVSTGKRGLTSVSPRLPTLILLCVLAFALRVYHLDAMSFWSDEGISVIRARVALPDLLSILPVEHTPLYFVALHQWMQVTGEGDFAVRFLSLFFGVLAVPLVYKLGEALDRDMGNRMAVSTLGLLAALLCAINPLQVWYSQEARMYSMLVTLCAGAAWCLLRAVELSGHSQERTPSIRSGIDKTPSKDAVAVAAAAPMAARPQHTSWLRSVSVYWFAFALLGAAALYTHFFAALALAALALWAGLLVVRRALDWRPAALGFGLIGLMFAPWLPRAVAALSFPGWQAAADPWSLPERYLVAYTLGTTIDDDWRWLALGFLLLLAVGAVALVRRRASAWLPILYVFVPFALLMLLALRKPGYHERYLIVITPMLFVLLAVGLDELRRTYAAMRQWITVHRSPFTAYPSRRLVLFIPLSFVLIASAFSLANLYFDPRFAKPDFRGAAQYVDALSRQGDGLIFDGPDPFKAFYRYFSRQRVTAYDDSTFDPQDEVETGTFLSGQVQAHERWWVVLYFHPPGPTEDWLAQHGYQTSSRWFNGIRVLLYATPSDAALRTVAPESVQAGVPLSIVDVRTLPQVQPGDVLPVIVRWLPTGPLPADYQVSLRLLDAAGNRVKQLDRRPLDGRVPTSQWTVGDVVEDRYGLLVPDDAAPGAYRVELILYALGGADVLHARVTAVTIAGRE